MRLSLHQSERIALELGLSLALLINPFGNVFHPDASVALNTNLRILAAVLMIFGTVLGLLVESRAATEPNWLRRPATYLLAFFFLLAPMIGPNYFESAERLFLWLAVAVGALGLTRTNNLRSLRILLVLALIIGCQALAERWYLMDDLRHLAETTWSRDEHPNPDLKLFMASQRARVTFGQANGLAAFFVLLLPFALWRSSCAAGGRRAATVLALALVIGLWASGSRGGALAALTATALAFSFLPGRGRSAARVVLGAAACCWFLVLAVYVAGPEFCAQDGPFQTLLLRRDYAQSALELTRPRGLGLELFGEGQALDSGRAYSRYAHQLVLGLVVETGFLALLPLLALALLIKGLWSSRKLAATSLTTANDDSQIWPAYLGLSVGVILGTVGFFTAIHAWHLSLVLGLAWSFDRYLVRPILRVGFSSADRWCLAAGALGVFLHAQIDFDLRIFSLTAALALVSALAWPTPPKPQRMRRSWRSSVAVCSLIIAVAAMEFSPLTSLAGIRSDLAQEAPEVRDAARKRLANLPDEMLRLPGLIRLRESSKEQR